jgi:hypothetical protein
MPDWREQLLSDISKIKDRDAVLKKYPQLKGDKKMLQSLYSWNNAKASGIPPTDLDEMYPEVKSFLIQPDAAPAPQPGATVPPQKTVPVKPVQTVPAPAANTPKPFQQLEASIQKHATIAKAIPEKGWGEDLTKKILGGIYPNVGNTKSAQHREMMIAEADKALSEKKSLIEKTKPLIDEVAKWFSQDYQTAKKKYTVDGTDMGEIREDVVRAEARNWAKRYGGGSGVEEILFASALGAIQVEQVKPKYEAELKSLYKQKYGKDMPTEKEADLFQNAIVSAAKDQVNKQIEKSSQELKLKVSQTWDEQFRKQLDDSAKRFGSDSPEYKNQFAQSVAAIGKLEKQWRQKEIARIERIKSELEAGLKKKIESFNAEEQMRIGAISDEAYKKASQAYSEAKGEKKYREVAAASDFFGKSQLNIGFNRALTGRLLYGVASLGDYLASEGYQSAAIDWMRSMATTGGELDVPDLKLGFDRNLAMALATRTGGGIGSSAVPMGAAMLTMNPLAGALVSYKMETAMMEADIWKERMMAGDPEAKQKADKAGAQTAILLPLYVLEMDRLFAGMKKGGWVNKALNIYAPELAQEVPTEYWQQYLQAKSSGFKGDFADFVAEDKGNIALETAIATIGMSTVFASMGKSTEAVGRALGPKAKDQAIISLAQRTQMAPVDFVPTPSPYKGPDNDPAAPAAPAGTAQAVDPQAATPSVSPITMVNAALEQAWMNGEMSDEQLVDEKKHAEMILAKQDELAKLGLEPDMIRHYIGLQAEMVYLQNQMAAAKDPVLQAKFEKDIAAIQTQMAKVIDDKIEETIFSVTTPFGDTYTATEKELDEIMNNPLFGAPEDLVITPIKGRLTPDEQKVADALAGAKLPDGLSDMSVEKLVQKFAGSKDFNEQREAIKMYRDQLNDPLGPTPRKQMIAAFGQDLADQVAPLPFGEVDKKEVGEKQFKNVTERLKSREPESFEEEVLQGFLRDLRFSSEDFTRYAGFGGNSRLTGDKIGGREMRQYAMKRLRKKSEGGIPIDKYVLQLAEKWGIPQGQETDYINTVIDLILEHPGQASVISRLEALQSGAKTQEEYDAWLERKYGNAQAAKDALDAMDDDLTEDVNDVIEKIDQITDEEAESIADGAMNNFIDENGNIDLSAIKTFLASDEFNAMPEKVKSIIKEVTNGLDQAETDTQDDGNTDSSEEEDQDEEETPEELKDAYQTENYNDLVKAWESGNKIYAVSEQDEAPTPVTSWEMLNNYPLDALWIVDQQAESQSENVVAPKKETKAKVRQETKTKLADETKKALDDFLDAFDELGNLGFAYDPEEQAKKQFKLYTAGAKFVAAMAKQGIYQFKDMVLTLAEKMGEIPGELFQALKKAYAMAYADDETGLMEDPKTLRTLTLEDILAEKDDSNELSGIEAFKEAFHKNLFSLWADLSINPDANPRPSNIIDLRNMAVEANWTGENGLPATDNEIFEAVESVLIRFSREIVAMSKDNQKVMKNLMTLYKVQPTISMRDSDRVMLQQYSTPIPYAYAAGVWMKNQNKYLEPTAGNGLLTVALDPSKVDVNEIDKTRFDMLADQGFSSVSSRDALEGFSGKYDGIIANPPFGSTDKITTQDGYPISELAQRIVYESLKTLTTDGKASFVIGGHTEYDEKGIMKGRDRFFFNYLYDNFNVVDVINVAGDLYGKQGTTYPTRLILIDGRRNVEGSPRKETRHAPMKSVKGFETVGLQAPDDAVISSYPELLNRVLKPKDYGQQIDIPSGMDTDKGSGNNIPGNRPGGRNQGGSGGRNTSGTVSKPGKGVSQGGARPPVSGNLFAGSDVQKPSESKSGRAGNNGNAAVFEGQGNALPPGAGPRPAVRPEVGRTNLQGRNAPDAGGSFAGVRNVSIENLSSENVEYIPSSNMQFEVGTVIPPKMAVEVYRHQDMLIEMYGNLADFVQSELEYEPDEFAAAFSSEQVDALAMAIHKAKMGSAMIIGDQTGVGKGRIAAGMVRWAVINGYKPVFITAKADLFSDFWRDLKDTFNAHLRYFIVNNQTPVTEYHLDESGDEVPVDIFRSPEKSNPDYKKILFNESENSQDSFDFVMATYSQFSGKKMADKIGFMKGMLKRGFFIMDESHWASGDSNTGELFREMTSSADAGLFLSATFAKRPDNMPVYATKTAMKDTGLDDEALADAILYGGPALQEAVAAQLSESGEMIRRERDFKGVEIDYIPLDKEGESWGVKDQSEYHWDVSRRMSEMMMDIIHFQRHHIRPYLDGIREAVKESNPEMSITNTPFASKVFNINKQMLLALKADASVDLAIKELKEGKKPVISLSYTMESFLSEELAVGDVVPRFDFSSILIKGLEGTLKTRTQNGWGKVTTSKIDIASLPEESQAAYWSLVKKIKDNTIDLNASPIDHITHRLEKAGYSVGELTGRQTRLVPVEDGGWAMTKFKKRNKIDLVKKFNSGKIDVIIMNRSVAQGISMHASSKFSDQRQRVMIITEPELDVNDEIQKRGRIDRVGQVVRGAYRYLVSSIPAEQRLMMMFKKKVASLDANAKTTQTNKANEVKVVDFLNKYGDQIVVDYLFENAALNDEILDPLKISDQIFSGERDYKPQSGDAHKVTGKVALLSPEKQKQFYDDISNRYTDLMNSKLATGEWDLESEVMKLNAEKISSNILIEGNNNSPFSRDVILDEYEIDVPRVPIKKEELIKMVNDEKAGNDVADYTAEIIDRVEEFYEKRKEAIKEDITKNLLEKRILIVNTIRAKMTEKNAPAEEIERAVKEAEERNDYEREEKIRAEFAKANSYKDRLTRFARFFYPGRSVRFPVGEGKNMVTHPAVFVKISFSEKGISESDSIYRLSPSGVKFHFAVDSEIVRDQRPATSNDWLYEAMMNSQMDFENNLDNWGKFSGGLRRKASIVSGNLLKGYGTVKVGRVVNFTTSENDIAKGILMPFGATAGEGFKGKRIVPISKAISILLGQRGAVSLGKDGFSLSFYGKIMSIIVPKSRKEGGVIFTNKEILDITGPFYQNGGSMIQEVNGESSAKKVGEVLTKLGFTAVIDEKHLPKSDGNISKLVSAPAGQQVIPSRVPEEYISSTPISLEDMGIGPNDTAGEIVDKMISYGGPFTEILKFIRALPGFKDISIQQVESLDANHPVRKVIGALASDASGVYFNMKDRPDTIVTEIAGKPIQGIVAINQGKTNNAYYTLTHELLHFLTIDGIDSKDPEVKKKLKKLEDIYLFMRSKRDRWLMDAMESSSQLPGGDKMPGKNVELAGAQKELDGALRELESAKKAFDAKRKELDKGIVADQTDLFGNRKSDTGNSLFDERASQSGRDAAMKPFRDRLNKAESEANRLRKKVEGLLASGGVSQGDLFSAFGFGLQESYGFTNFREFMVELLMNPMFRANISNIAARSEMEFANAIWAGADPDKRSILAMIKDYIRSLFKSIFGKSSVNLNSPLVDQAVTLAEDIFFSGESIVDRVYDTEAGNYFTIYSNYNSGRSSRGPASKTLSFFPGSGGQDTDFILKNYIARKVVEGILSDATILNVVQRQGMDPVQAKQIIDQYRKNPPGKKAMAKLSTLARAEKVGPVEDGEKERKLNRMIPVFDPKGIERINEHATRYLPKSMKVSMEEADKFIVNIPTQDLKDFATNVHSVLNTLPIDVQTAIRIAAILRMQSEVTLLRAQGDHAQADRVSEDSAEIWNHMTPLSTELGRAVNLYKRLISDPAFSKMSIQNKFRAFVAMAEKAIGRKLTDGEKKKLFEMFQAWDAAPDGIGKQIAMAKIMAYINTLRPINLWDLLTNIWYSKILSGPATHFTNLFSNIFNGPMEMFVQSLAIGKKYKSNPGKIAFDLTKAWFSGIRKGYVESRHIMIYGPTKEESTKLYQNHLMEELDWTKANIPSFWKKVLNSPVLLSFNPKILKYVGRMLAAEDAMLQNAGEHSFAEVLAYLEAAKSNKGADKKLLKQMAQAMVASDSISYAKAQQQALDEAVAALDMLRDMRSEAEIAGNMAEVKAISREIAMWDRQVKGKHKNIAFRKRVYEILEAKATETEEGARIMHDAAARASKVTYNFPPKGLFTRTMYDVLIYASEKVLPFKFFVPFVRIVSNLVDNMINYSPAGFVTPLISYAKPSANTTKDEKGARPLTDEERTEVMIKAMIGTITWVFLYNLAVPDGDDDEPWFSITGAGPSDQAKVYEAQETGWRPYSIQTRDGETISYKATPFFALLASIGAISDEMKFGKKDISEKDIWDKMAISASGFVKSIFDNSWMQGLDELLNSAKAENRFGKLDFNVVDKVTKKGVDVAGAFVMSNLSKQIVRMHDRITETPMKKAETPYERIITNMPIVRNVLPHEITNVWGDPVVNETYLGFLPLRAQVTEKDDVISLLVKNGVWIGRPRNNKEIYDGDVLRPLTNDEYYRYYVLASQKLKSMLNDRETIEYITEMDREGNSDAIKTFIQSRKQNANQEAFMELFGNSGINSEW